MSISPEMDVALDVRPLRERAVELLSKQPNPFDGLTRPQRADDNFGQLHLDALHQPIRDLLLACIDSYRLPEYVTGEQLKPTRSILVLGDRGSGKTHLLQSMVNRADRLAQLIIRPSFIDPVLRFEEYLLAQMRIALGELDEFHQHRPIEIIARALSRRLLLQALRHATPAEMLFAIKGEQALSWGQLWSGGEHLAPRWQTLLRELESTDTRDDLPGAIGRSGLPPAAAVRLVDGYLRVAESGTDSYALLRRRLYSHFVRSVLLGEVEGLSAFLREGYAGAIAGTLGRQELVDHMLQLLLEACALVRMPVVVAFDNMERLIAPQGEFSHDLASGFIRNIAQAIDTTRGLLFMPFIESTLWESQIAPAGLDEFARLRLEQGVSLPGRPTTYLLRLHSPSADEVRSLVRSRVRALLNGLGDTSGLPDHFPFEQSSFEEMTASGVNLRNILYRLRDDWHAALHPDDGKPAKEKDPPDPDPRLPWRERLERIWSNALAQVTRTTPEHQDLAACLGLLAQNLLVGTVQDGWRLTAVTPTVQVGEHAAYGFVTLLDWRATEERLDGPRMLRVAVGFLLASTQGMQHDLRAKFDLYTQYNRGYRLVVLWPIEGEQPLADRLPSSTRAVWDANSDYHWRTEIRSVRDIDIRRIRAFVRCRDLAEQEAGETVPQAELAELMRSRGINAILPLLLPPAGGGSE